MNNVNSPKVKILKGRVKKIITGFMKALTIPIIRAETVRDPKPLISIPSKSFDTVIKARELIAIIIIKAAIENSSSC